VAALVFTVPTLINGPLWAASAPGVRKLGAAHRSLARTLLGEDIPPPPPLRPYPVVHVRTPDADRLCGQRTSSAGTEGRYATGMSGWRAATSR
jgi:hypothetical protein